MLTIIWVLSIVQVPRETIRELSKPVGGGQGRQVTVCCGMRNMRVASLAVVVLVSSLGVLLMSYQRELLRCSSSAAFHKAEFRVGLSSPLPTNHRALDVSELQLPPPTPSATPPKDCTDSLIIQIDALPRGLPGRPGEPLFLTFATASVDELLNNWVLHVRKLKLPALVAAMDFSVEPPPPSTASQLLPPPLPRAHTYTPHLLPPPPPPPPSPPFN